MKNKKQDKFLSNYFSVNLSLLRKKQNLSQAEMAEKLGMARTTYSAYEGGRSEPGIATLLYFSQEFNISINDLCLKNLQKESYNRLNFEKNSNNDQNTEIDLEKEDLREKLKIAEMKINVLEETIKTTIHKLVDNLSK